MKKLLLLSTIFLSSYAVMAQANADEVVNKHIEAIGGAENWKKINSIIMEGSMSVMGTDVALVITQLNNKGSRQDISAAGMAGFVIMTPETGYIFMPFQGQQAPEPMTADDIKEGVDDLDIQGSRLIDYKAKGHTVELMGTEEIEGTECYKLKVTRKNSGEQTMFIDKDNYLLVRSTQKRKAMGQEMDVNIDYSDYREVANVKIPHAIGQGMGTVVMTSVKVNEAIPASSFELPK